MSTRVVLSEQPSDMRLAPWGHPPTPLLPRWYRENLAQHYLPARIRRLNPHVARVGDLDSFWDAVREPIDKRSMASLAHLAGTNPPPSDYAVLPPDLDHSELLTFPLKLRTINCVKRALHKKTLQNGTVAEFMGIKNFGILSLLDLMCVVELVAENPEVLSRESHGISEQPEQTHDDREPWIRADASLDTIIAAAREFSGVRTLGDLLRSDLSRPISAGGLDEALDAIALPDVDQPLAGRVIAKLTTELEKATPIESTIINQRLHLTAPVTLQQLGIVNGRSREWIRQLEKRLKTSLNESVGPAIGILADILSERVGPVTTELDLDQHIADVFNLGTPYTPAAQLACRMLRAKLDYSCHGELCVSAEALDLARTLKDVAIGAADDVGLIDEATLLAHLPSPQWNTRIDSLADLCGLCRISDQLALRRTAKAQAKAALIAIGRSATKEEIAAVAELSPTRVGAHLSNIPSVARADKYRWGLVEWIDDAYDGISCEIMQRIHEGGGTTTLDRLVDELPRRFGVSEASVHAYVKTPKFVLRDGTVRIRQDDEPYLDSDAELRNSPGTFALGNRRVGLTYRVDQDVLRGSGRQLPLAAAAIIGLTVNNTMRFAGPSRTVVTATFPDTSATGPTLGSARGLAEMTCATEGHLLTIILDAENMSVSGEATDPVGSLSGWALIARLTGVKDCSSLAHLASVLHCAPGEVRALLQNRGDSTILEALPTKQPTTELQQALADLDAEMRHRAM